ncbi:hypothetical protein OH77DRAFT_642027 [Trametes cingulata]|nr:hypothetical protein OH77DRAFT_642027 [Trametes cingulata]
MLIHSSSVGSTSSARTATPRKLSNSSRGPTSGAIAPVRSPCRPTRTLSNPSVHEPLEDVIPAAFSRLAALSLPVHPRHPSHVECHLMRCSPPSGRISYAQGPLTVRRRPHLSRTACAPLGMPRRGPDHQFS